MNNAFTTNGVGNTLTFGAGATLSQTEGNVVLSGINYLSPSQNSTLVNNGTFPLSGGTLQSNNGNVVNAGVITLGGGESATFNAPTFNNNGAIGFSGAGTLAVYGSVFNGGIVSVGNGGLVRFAGGTLDNAGVINVGSGGTLTLSSGGTRPNLGLISVAAGATLELGAAFSGGVTFAPGGMGMLVLDAPGNFTGTIAGLAGGDTIDFAGVTVGGARFSGGALLVTIGSATYTYQVSGVPADQVAVVRPDAAGTGSNVVVMPASLTFAAPQVNTASRRSRG